MPIASLTVLTVTLILTVLHVPYPGILSALRRDPAAPAAGQAWRIVTPLFVLPDPGPIFLPAKMDRKPRLTILSGTVAEYGKEGAFLDQTESRQAEFWHGARAEAPILLGVIPFGLIFGAAAINARVPAPAAQAMSSVIFAGSAQFIGAQLIGAGASGLVILLVVFVVNLRHVLYSASMAPRIRHLGRAWKVLLAYLLTDECYAVTIMHYNRAGSSPRRHWYYLGAGLALWASWQISTALGIYIGAQMPRDWPLSFALPLTFIALVVPALRDWPGIAAAIVAALTGLLAINFPYKTGLLLAALLGILAGMALEGRRR